MKNPAYPLQAGFNQLTDVLKSTRGKETVVK